MMTFVCQTRRKQDRKLIKDGIPALNKGNKRKTKKMAMHKLVLYGLKIFCEVISERK